MKSFTREELTLLQKDQAHIRNLCILAHVDHGKTTLADSLVASNSIISKRLAGKMRYMDSRRDEQERGITMKSSSISLHHVCDNHSYLVNLIDSPGHVDFSGEVSAAVRLCDGALILVDVIEGICPQTKTALKQAWTEGLKPVLVLNKMDRLILEKKLSPLDAYVHLQQIVEQINAIVGVLFTSDLFESSTLTSENKEQPVNIQVEPDDQQYDWSSGIELTDDSQVYFAPESGNVVFASAIDGWGFTIDLFSQFLTKKLSINKDTLLRTLWGDYYFDSKRKRIFKGAQAKAKKPLFVQMVLENIWSAYETIAVKRDVIATEKIVKSLSLSVLPRDLNNSDPKVSIQAIFGQWLPLASSLLDVVCKLLPSPLELTEKRAERLMCSNLKRFENLPKETQLLKNDFVSCSAADDVTKIICISKMVCVDRKLLPENKPRFLSHEEIAMRREQAKAKQLLAQESNHLGSSSGTEITESQLCAVEEDKDIFIAFARVFSGTVRQGDEFYVLGPKYDPAARTSEGDINADHTLLDLGSKQHVTKTKLGRLFVLMGRELESIDCVPAGNVVGIADLDEHVLKSATLSTSLFCPPFVDLHVPAPPILKVAIEPQNPNEMAQLVKGLKLLDQADPNVLVKLEDNGEHVIITTGEVHLQKCVDDLSEHFAKIKLNVSKPIVPFKETIAHPRKIDMVNEVIDERNFAVKDANGHEGNGTLQVFTPNKKSFIKMRAVPLPESVTELLEKHKTLLKQLSSKNSHKDDIASATHDLRELLRIEFSNAGTPWSSDSVDKIWSFGPKYCGPNILFNNVEAYNRSCVWDSTKLSDESIGLLSKYDSSFVGGFQLASQSGPLCEEPMIGVGFVVDEWEMSPELEGQASDPHGPISGQIMSTVKDACRRSFQAQPQRLRIAMYSCTIQVASEALGKMYAVLGRRSGRVLHADLQEGSQTFTVTSVLPIIESFHFGDELRKQTSGMASPQLIFSHWETLDLDPFWVPSTEEEYLLYGEKADTENRARKYMNYVRRRKGLPVDEKIVEHAEKQRTLTRNK